MNPEPEVPHEKAIQESVSAPEGNIVVVRVLSQKEELKSIDFRTSNSVAIIEVLHGDGRNLSTLWNWGGPVLKPGTEYLVCAFGPLILSGSIVELKADNRERIIGQAKNAVAKWIASSNMRTPPKSDAESDLRNLKIENPPIFESLVIPGADFAQIRILTRTPTQATAPEPEKYGSKYEVLVVRSFFGRPTGPRRLTSHGPGILKPGLEYVACFTNAGYINDSSGAMEIPSAHQREIILASSQSAARVIRLRDTWGDPFQKGDEPRTLTDSQIRSVLSNPEGDIAVSKILSAKEVGIGTRSWGAEYGIEILESFTGKKTGSKQIEHFGPMALKETEEYIISLSGLSVSQPFLNCVKVPKVGRAEFIKKHREAVKRLMHPESESKSKASESLNTIGDAISGDPEIFSEAEIERAVAKYCPMALYRILSKEESDLGTRSPKTSYEIKVVATSNPNGMKDKKIWTWGGGWPTDGLRIAIIGVGGLILEKHAFPPESEKDALAVFNGYNSRMTELKSKFLSLSSMRSAADGKAEIVLMKVLPKAAGDRGEKASIEIMKNLSAGKTGLVSVKLGAAVQLEEGRWYIAALGKSLFGLKLVEAMKTSKEESEPVSGLHTERLYFLKEPWSKKYAEP